MPRILIVHPEGNINNNPSLSGIVCVLCANGYRVDIVSPRVSFLYQGPPCESSRMLLVDSANRSGPFIFSRFIEENGPERLLEYTQRHIGAYDLVIGVDRGIIEASWISRAKGVPCGFMSYEIFFADEAGIEFKQPEIDACKGISFAVCQDPVRGEKLATENQIDPGRLLYIPVGGLGINRNRVDKSVYQALGIPADKKVALFMGSFDRWGGIDALAESAASWPREWILLLHARYGPTPSAQRYVDRYRSYHNVYLSIDPFARLDDMKGFIAAADIGIAFYHPTFENMFTGKNLKYIGLASGKIATYLQHGVPVVINEIGKMSDYVRAHRLGWVVNSPDQIDFSFGENERNEIRENCFRFFDENLDLKRTAGPLLERIRNLLVQS